MSLASPLKRQSNNFSGRAFCSLPLPVGSDSAETRLPVHVSASFGVGDYRRDFKWTGNDQKDDPNARWGATAFNCVKPGHFWGFCFSYLCIEIMFNPYLI